jgi:hypothetical protein
MYQSVKEWIKVYSIILLIILALRSFFKAKGSFKNQLSEAILTGSLIPIIIYLFNI